jgi:putative transposase/transposase-like zinc-binding protein
VASLAPAYLPRRPTETVLYDLVRTHLETFLAYARANYEGGLPRYVEQELRAYLACGDFSRGFARAHCDTCGHDLLIAFSCGSRSICPSCTGRRMANRAAFLVDRVLPDVPLRQYVLTMPYELRKLVAFKADVLTAIARIFVESVFALYRGRAKDDGVETPQCGAVNFVQRCGSSVNLHVHYHLVVLDGVFVRDAEGQLEFHPAHAPTAAELDAIVARTARRSIGWLRRHGYVDDSPLEERSNELPEQTALEACAAIAMGRGNVATLPRDMEQDDAHGAGEDHPGKRALAVDRDGFSLHAGVRIEAGDDMGRERLCRYGPRPPLSLDRMRRLPGGRIAYRLKYVDRGRRGKHRVMTGIEFMARLAAIICPPRYPLTRFAGVLAPRSKWRREVVPKPRERPPPCGATPTAKPAAVENPASKVGTAPRSDGRDERCTPPQRPSTAIRPIVAPTRANEIAKPPAPLGPSSPQPRPSEVVRLAPNILSVQHWYRLLGGALYAIQPRIDWATLLRRSLSVDALECPKCHARLRVVAVLTEREPIRRILAHLGLPTDAPAVARARDPTDEPDGDGPSCQLALGLA